MTTTMQYLQEVIITMLLFILLSSGRVFVFPHCPFLQQLHYKFYAHLVVNKSVVLKAPGQLSTSGKFSLTKRYCEEGRGQLCGFLGIKQTAHTQI